MSLTQEKLSFWAVARRPRWLGALVLALVIAAVFAGLGQWQWERSFSTVDVPQRATETPVSLQSVAMPQQVITSDASGRMVSVTCSVIPGDDIWVTNRRLPGGTGQWLIRHCQTPDNDSLAIAVGWVPDTVGSRPSSPPVSTGTEFVGRYVPTESPQTSDFEAGERSAISVAELVNLWADPGPVYGGYLVAERAPDGLQTIPTSAPELQGKLNWLNIFYAAEWAIFAVFALYLWYRLVRDEWERETAPTE